MESAQNSAGGQGESPSRSELRLVCQAVRQDWPVTLEQQITIMGQLVGVFGGGDKPAKPRTVIAAAKAIAALESLALKQQALDLARQKAEGFKGDKPLAELVAEAEQRAQNRLRERGE